MTKWQQKVWRTKLTCSISFVSWGTTVTIREPLSTLRRLSSLASLLPHRPVCNTKNITDWDHSKPHSINCRWICPVLEIQLMASPFALPLSFKTPGPSCNLPAAKDPHILTYSFLSNWEIQELKQHFYFLAWPSHYSYTNGRKSSCFQVSNKKNKLAFRNKEHTGERGRQCNKTQC